MEWNFDLRKMIFNRVLNEFGPYRDWVGPNTPSGKGSSVELKSVFEDLAEAFSKLTGRGCSAGAVEQQFEWGKTKQPKLSSNGHFYTFIMNKAAAMEVGFINSGDLPDLTLMG